MQNKIPETIPGEVSDIPEGYKVTELGVIPEEWSVVTLDETAKINYGKAKPQDTGKIPVYGSGGIYGYVSNSLINQPTIIIGRKGDAGKVWLVEKSSWPSDTTYYLEWKNNPPDRYFVFNYLNFAPLSTTLSKTTLPSLKKTDLEKKKIPLPPLPEQHAIATTLRTVQEAKERTDAVIAATKALKAAMMKHLFTYGPVPPEDAERVALKESEIGPVPEGWEILTIDEVFDSKLGKMLSPASKTGKFSKPYIRNANVQWDRVDISDLYEMDFSEKNYDRYGLISGDVLICEGGEIGRTAIWRGEIKECYYQKAIHRLRPRDERILPEFFSYHMMYAFLIGRTYPELGTTTTIAHLPGMKLKSLLTPVPPRNEQEQIVTILDSINKKLATEQSRKEALDTLFASLLHDLMTAKIRVKNIA